MTWTPRIILSLMLLVSSVGLISLVNADTPDDPPRAGNGSFQRTWERTDLPVAEHGLSRTWMWGEEAISPVLNEDYSASPGGQRAVQYFDKSRMELTHPDAPDDGQWYVTNGLLVKELMTGQLQVGDQEFLDRQPAEVNIAGDPGNPNGATYATLNAVVGAPPAEVGSILAQRLDRAGNVSDDAALVAQQVTAAQYVPETNHTIAAPFWEFMTSSGEVFEDVDFVTAPLFVNPYYATGFPITEAYWTEVTVLGTPKVVLFQCFERRCLTYTPDNPAGWQVEAGNVGRHYYEWRYATSTPVLAALSATTSATAYQIVYSGSSDRANPVSLDGATVSGIIYPFTTPDDGVDDVTFFLNGKKVRTERNAPYDFAGGSASTPNPWDTTTVTEGEHTISTSLLLTDGTRTSVTSTFVVDNVADVSSPTPTPTQESSETTEPTVEPTTEATPAPSSTENQPTLVDSYVVSGKSPGYNHFKYRPRQFVAGLVAPSHKGDKQVTDPGAYNGWDVLVTRNEGGARVYSGDPWITVRLNRAAQVAVVWQDKDAPPQWLASWPLSGTVSIGGSTKQVYLKSFEAGDFTLGAVWDTAGDGPYGRETYLVLFAEANGVPTPAPSVPDGLETPQPNATCPTWVHDRYVATGPDGQIYPTWHAQIDPVYWCYFHHDHGTNPRHFGDGTYQPLFGYAGHHHGMHENHHGFKVYVGDIDADTEFIWTAHLGSHTLARYCGRFHETNLAVWDQGERVVDVYTAGDYGPALYNRDQSQRFAPPQCPDQGNVATGNNINLGQRILPSGHNLVFYEGWRVDIQNSYDVLGLSGESVTFWLNDGIAYCNDLDCDTMMIESSKSDANHRVQDMKFRIEAPAHAGVFYTNSRGDALLSSDDPTALRQYIKPGTSISFENAGIGKCIDLEGWGRQLTCHLSDAEDGVDEREGSLGPEFYANTPYLR